MCLAQIFWTVRLVLLARLSVTAQSGADFAVLCGENDLDGAPSEVLRCEDDLDDALSEVSCCETDSDGKQVVVLGQPAQSARCNPFESARSSGDGDLVRARWQRADFLGSGGAPPLGRRAMHRSRQARVERAEAGSDNFDFASSFMLRESHIARSHRVNATLHENLLCTSSGCRITCTTHNSPACDTGVHDAMQHVIRLCRNSGNSSNSWGDTEEGGLHFCVPGGTKSLSTSTRCGVRRSAVDESAHYTAGALKVP